MFCYLYLQYMYCEALNKYLLNILKYNTSRFSSIKYILITCHAILIHSIQGTFAYLLGCLCFVEKANKSNIPTVFLRETFLGKFTC